MIAFDLISSLASSLYKKHTFLLIYDSVMIQLTWNIHHQTMQMHFGCFLFNARTVRTAFHVVLFCDQTSISAFFFDCPNSSTQCPDKYFGCSLAPPT